MRVPLILAGIATLVSAEISFMSNSLKEHQTYGLRAAATYGNASITYSDANMSCQACVRGGYDYCQFRSFPDSTTHDDFKNCT